MKDGEEKRVECELVLAYQAPDESVGIYAGFYVAGIEIDGDFLEVDERNIRMNGADTRRYVFEAKATAALEKLCCDHTESLQGDDE